MNGETATTPAVEAASTGMTEAGRSAGTAGGLYRPTASTMPAAWLHRVAEG